MWLTLAGPECGRMGPYGAFPLGIHPSDSVRTPLASRGVLDQIQVLGSDV